MPDGTVNFLVRPDGVGSYRRASRSLVARGMRQGKLPLPSDGDIDFRLVREPKP